jgi:catechol 2,3-dioxygenase-like lactoylglutathione lyase family enzyme
MNGSNTLLLYVADVSHSVRFYTSLLGQGPVEVSATFALFILPSGLAMELWASAGVQPVPLASGGGCELGFKAADPDATDQMYLAWKAKGAVIALPPSDLEFGRSFVALDPDGHRLRVYALTSAQ